MVQALAVDVRTKADVVGTFGPVEVCHELTLRVLAVVGHEVAINAQGSEVIRSCEVELRPTALEVPRSIGSRNTQHVGPGVFAQTRLLGGRALAGPAEMSVHKEGGSKGVSAHNRC